MLRVKKGVVFKDFKEHIIFLLEILCNLSEIIKKDIWITSANDGKHSKNSYHYLDLALDIRIRNLTSDEIKLVLTELTLDSGRYYLPFFDIVLESDHIHVEWDERRYLESLNSDY